MFEYILEVDYKKSLGILEEISSNIEVLTKNCKADKISVLRGQFALLDNEIHLLNVSLKRLEEDLKYRKEGHNADIIPVWKEKINHLSDKEKLLFSKYTSYLLKQNSEDNDTYTINNHNGDKDWYNTLPPMSSDTLSHMQEKSENFTDGQSVSRPNLHNIIYSGYPESKNIIDIYSSQNHESTIYQNRNKSSSPYSQNNLVYNEKAQIYAQPDVNKIIQDQDEQLNYLEGTIYNLKEIGTNINDEISLHQHLLSDVDSHMIRTGDMMKKSKKMLTSVSKGHSNFFLYFFIFILLFLLFLIFIYHI